MKTKKELKAEYKQQKPDAGVFQVKSEKNGMLLMESSANMHSKWNRHRTELRFGSHRNAKLQKDWNELGEENFTFSILSVLKIIETEDFDLQGELKILGEMVAEEIKIPGELKY